jgi:hypothetical protein
MAVAMNARRERHIPCQRRALARAEAGLPVFSSDLLVPTVGSSASCRAVQRSSSQ